MKKYKKIYSYYIEDVSKETVAWDMINGKRVRMFLQKDGTFGTATGFARKKFKIKLFAELYMKKWKDVRVVTEILYHSKDKNCEDYKTEYIGDKEIE